MACVCVCIIFKIILKNREHLYAVFYKTCKEFVIQLFLKKIHICHYRTGLHKDEHYLNSKMDYSFILYTNIALVFSTLISIEYFTIHACIQ